MKQIRKREKAGTTSGTQQGGPVSPAPALPRWLVPAAFVLLAALTAASFWGVLSCSFVDLDDNQFIVENPHVNGGLSWQNIKWAFSSKNLGFYFPITMITHMIDSGLYGNWAGGHHLTNLVLHIISALVLFAALLRMTGSAWKSGFVAALFAVHPLHVESVAWVSERKDVLCALFWFLCLLAYARYAEKPSLSRYLPVFLAFILGLLSKTMILTLPFTLLLLDYWPLGRWSPGEGPASGEQSGAGLPLKRLLWEKAPLFALVPLFAFLTVSAQKEARAITSVNVIPAAQRVSNSLLSYAGYLKKAFLPIDLAVYYPLRPGNTPVLLALLSGALLAALTAALMWYGKKRKFVVTGWLWYLGTLVPVIGLVQVGLQSMADRYTYVPLVGVFIVVVWMAGEIAEKSIPARRIAAAAGVACVAALSFLTHVQVGYWKDSLTLFSRAVAVTSDNWFAQNNLAIALHKLGRTDEAVPHFLEALRISPGESAGYYNYAIALADVGKEDEAIERLEQARKLFPDSVDILNRLGRLFLKKNRPLEAAGYLGESVRLDPEVYETRNDLGNALAAAGRQTGAVEQYREAIRINPSSYEAMNNLGLALAREGRQEEAIELFKEAVRVNPDFYDAHNNLGTAYGQVGRLDYAAAQYREALRVRPESAEAMNNLGIVLASAGKVREAEGYFREAVRLSPGFEDALKNLETAEKLLKEQKK